MIVRVTSDNKVVKINKRYTPEEEEKFMSNNPTGGFMLVDSLPYIYECIGDCFKWDGTKIVNDVEASTQRYVDYAMKMIQIHIDNKAKELQYDDINSISKYLVQGNPFKTEAETLSLWCANCWSTAISIFQEVEAGTRVMPKTTEIIPLLPTYGA